MIRRISHLRTEEAALSLFWGWMVGRGLDWVKG